MIVEQILNHKGHAVVTLKEDNTLREAAQLLDEKKIGAVVALGRDEQIIGVLSERDIVRQVARHGAEALDMPVGSAMTRAVVTVYGETPVDEALQTMTDRRIRHLPVIQSGRLTGVISIGDLVKWKIAEAQAEADAMKSYLSVQY
ncbi:MAG: CBS domain-containing protein [Hyphomonas sp.]|uniref:CBS domain-containing protein n=1 Tax=Hyphomonas sp. TaxID=87 RepID=UPI0017EF1EC0|nr:CBS domain-containing protein [Hyphomonas sp.]MBU3919722.1 CBS domain-containing protein [Alphaproteobacteria bacterium]MBA3069100.1 CBS domain-containing protein [Hyphomonas sp.]MBU4063573.1 CBS domain-containing protein [Alphaproteobacteria bacterium]MBU4165040.1 CBS domain-containing protein [Alphaproteobacteria bacterium]MBU4569514.1 CBS domain-containing protein [Alphaproteobacteria bacterium]